VEETKESRSPGPTGSHGCYHCRGDWALATHDNVRWRLIIGQQTRYWVADSPGIRCRGCLITVVHRGSLCWLPSDPESSPHSISMRISSNTAREVAISDMRGHAAGVR